MALSNPRLLGKYGRKGSLNWTYTLIWYGKQGIVDELPFEAEKAARDHALANFSNRNEEGIVAVEVRKDDGTVVFSKAGAS